MITIFTDGSSLGNPGSGGWGAVVGEGERIQELGGFEDSTTNNRMEMKAIVEALKSLKTGDDISLFTDSQYTINGITKWVYGWKQNGWMTKNKTEVLNRDLWEELLSVVEGKKVTWNHVAGHVGIPGNERVDTIANSFASQKTIDLYNGLATDYLVDLTKTKAESGVKKQSSGAGGKAYSYLSLLEGELKRHQTWSDCEKRVKGKNAKFRKAISSEHEKEIMKEWGVIQE